MEPEVSLPHSQVSATCPYPEPAQSSPYPRILLDIIRNTGQLLVGGTDNSITTETDITKHFEWHVVSKETVRMLLERVVATRLPPNLPYAQHRIPSRDYLLICGQ
jgi:hypothetical protein